MLTTRDNRPDNPAQEVPVRLRGAATDQCLALAFAFGHGGILPVTLTAVATQADPTVLWRLSRGRDTAHATIIPGVQRSTITWFFNGVMDRVENYDSVELAVARADDIKGVLLRDGWAEQV